MAIKLDIALEQLAGTGVAEAIARLVGALGNSMDPIAPLSPVAKPRAVAPVAAAPAVLADVPDAAERYRRFVAGLPDRSRRFIEMVRSEKLLKISDAMRALGLTAPKAMGGLTGSIGRWAPNRGVKVPYETTTSDGERAWRWIGSPVDEAQASSAPARSSETPTMLPAARPPVMSAPPAALPPVEVAAKPIAVKPVAKPTVEAAKPVAVAAKPVAKPVIEPAKPVETLVKAAEVAVKAAEVAVKAAEAPVLRAPDLRDFEGLPPKSQQFLTLVASRGLVTREEALEALELRRPKELGGATEPIVRRCREREIDRPYVAGKRDGKRVWIWSTQPIPADVVVT